jgi:radical SAM protein with 4Fe4S-binding SPASM domain
MDDVVWNKILYIAQRSGCHIIFSGYGEPLCNPNFILYIKKLNSIGITSSFSTNGIMLTKTIADKLRDIKRLSHINISLDSTDPEIYHSIRGADLNQALKGIKTLVNSVEISERTAITISSIVMERNLDSLYKFPKFLSKMKVNKWVLQKLIYNGSDTQVPINPSKLIESLKADCLELGIDLEMAPPLDMWLTCRELPDKDSLAGNTSIYETKQCCTPWEIPFINSDGKVFPCCQSDDSNIMGDLKHQSFEEIWMGKEFNKFRLNLLSGINIPSICSGCNAVSAGLHPFNYSAEVIIEESQLICYPQTQMRLVVIVRNTGLLAWTRKTNLRIGTANKRDRPSALYHPTWLSSNRIGSFKEESVSSGELASFEFSVSCTSRARSEVFQLVIDGVCWLPLTKFEVKVIDESIPKAIIRRIGRVIDHASVLLNRNSET